MPFLDPSFDKLRTRISLGPICGAIAHDDLILGVSKDEGGALDATSVSA